MINRLDDTRDTKSLVDKKKMIPNFYFDCFMIG